MTINPFLCPWKIFHQCFHHCTKCVTVSNGDVKQTLHSLFEISDLFHWNKIVNVGNSNKRSFEFEVNQAKTVKSANFIIIHFTLKMIANKILYCWKKSLTLCIRKIRCVPKECLLKIIKTFWSGRQCFEQAFKKLQEMTLMNFCVSSKMDRNKNWSVTFQENVKLWCDGDITKSWAINHPLVEW